MRARRIFDNIAIVMESIDRQTGVECFIRFDSRRQVRRRASPGKNGGGSSVKSSIPANGVEFRGLSNIIESEHCE
jgi:hypothetical protein